MRKRIISKVLIPFAIIAGVLGDVSKSSETKLSKCPSGIESGTSFWLDGPENWKLVIKKQKDISLMPNNSSLSEEIGVLKLKLLEEFRYFVEQKISVEDGRIEPTSDFSWENMKLPIAAMVDLGACIDKDRVFVSGGWSKKSMDNADRIIDFEKAWDELADLSLDEIDRLEENYPEVFECNDAACIREIIKRVKKG